MSNEMEWNGTHNWQTHFLILCFSGPLVLLLWPVYQNLSPERQALVREGTVFFGVSVVLFFLFRLFTEIPLIGSLFMLLSILYWMAYLFSCVWIIVKKREDARFTLPFISTHAERLENKDVL